MNYFKNIFAVIVLFSLWLAQELNAQERSPIEKNWFHTYLIDSSPDGSWIHYTNHFMDASSTGHVKNIQTSESYSFSESNWGKFSSNSKWFTMPLNSNSLLLQDLEKGSMQTIDSLSVHHFSHTGEYLITQSTKDALTITALDENKVLKAGTSKIFELNPQKEVMVMAIKSVAGESLQLFNLESFSTFVIMEDRNSSFSKIAWSANGEKLAFIFSSDNGKLFNIGVFDLKTKTTQFLDWDSLSNETLAVSNTHISVSNSGKKVYFHTIPREDVLVEKMVPEIWDVFDEIIYPRKNFISSGKQGPWNYVWFPKEKKLVSIGDKNTPHSLFNPESDYALVFDAYGREPQFSYNTFADLYVRDIKSGKREMIVSNQFTAFLYAHLSPDGNFLAYFKDKAWWLYNMKNRSHINLTIDIPHPVINNKSPRGDIPEPFGLAGWSKDGSNLYLYDEYDVWKLSRDGKKKQRITNGREAKINYKLVYGKNDIRTDYGDLGFNTFNIDDTEGLLFSAKNHHTLEMGYYSWQDSKLKLITWRQKRLSDLIKLDRDNLVFMQQSLTEPISIENYNLQTKDTKTVYKGNPEWDQFKWPKSELFHYNTELADSLNGILIYPINYDMKKKYPLVVSTYQEQSFLFHEFSPPYIYNEIGFNYLNYALDDYFVLLPDIEYKHNAPGISAAICIEEAVKSALNIASIDKSKIGLIGHSHGGYDTAFTVTQTDLFATAVVGSAILNLESFYFDIYKLAGLPEMVRVENANFFMSKSFYDSPELYRRNSPLHNATYLNTPILIWSGKEDANVNPNQSLQMYLALRRLGKPAKLIYYKGENHVLNKVENKTDLTKRIKEWFDGHLK